MKVLKRNQVIIFVIALMLITAGYLNFTTNANPSLETAGLADSEQMASIGDAKLVSANVAESNVVSNETVTKENTVQENQVANTVSEKTNTVNTSAQTTNKTSNDQYFTSSRLGRDTMYSQMIESYQKILENTNVSESQKAIAQTEIKKINDLKNAIMISENLIKTKGFEDVIIFVNDSSINIIVKGENLSQEQIAQVQNIVTREMKSEIENIHISNK